MPPSTTAAAERFDTVVVGAGAAGLMAAIWTRRTHPERSVLVLDGASRLGAKILISGGGRCNVTHHAVDETAFSGSTPAAVRKILLRFDVPATVAFFEDLGVTLKREETGKLFPVSDRARTVLDALLGEAARRGVTIRHPRRVDRVERVDPRLGPLAPSSGAESRFAVSGDWGSVLASRVVLATGGKSVPKTGSDGHGYAVAGALGHTLTPLILPALVPLTLPRNHPVTALSGVSLPASIEVRTRTGSRLAAFTDSTLFTHFGLSGPAVLDVSRHYLLAAAADPETRVTAGWLPEGAEETIDRQLRELAGRTVLGWLRERMPERLARVLLTEAALDPSLRGSALPRDARRRLGDLLARYPLPITGSRGFAVAEVTAGGVPLSELHLNTMESRIAPGLYLVGEILDVDGRIGGFNFQWAWASGYVAGVA